MNHRLSGPILVVALAATGLDVAAIQPGREVHLTHAFACSSPAVAAQLATLQGRQFGVAMAQLELSGDCAVLRGTVLFLERVSGPHSDGSVSWDVWRARSALGEAYYIVPADEGRGA